MLYVPDTSEFQWVYSNVSATRPIVTATPYGLNLSVNLEGYISTQILVSSANVLYDCYGIELTFNNYAASAAIRNGMAQIYINTEGGTIPSTANDIQISNLIFGSSAPTSVGRGGITYYFPIFIKAGSTIHISGKGTVTSNVGVMVKLYGAPKNPHSIKVGKYVDTYGVDSANNRGTTITMGTTAEGAFTQLGTATSRSYWWSQVAFTQVDTTMTLANVHCDLSFGTSTTLNKPLITDRIFNVTAAEQISSGLHVEGLTGNIVPTGSFLYGRAQSSSAADTTPGMACYMVGG